MATTTVLTNAGRAAITGALLSGTSGTWYGYMGFGTGVHTAAVTDTALTTECTTANIPSYARASCTNSQQTTSVTNDTFQQVATLNANSSTGAAITEAGTFSAATGGTMFLETTFSAINISGSDTLQLILSVQFQ
jgi:hypothetical protein